MKLFLSFCAASFLLLLAWGSPRQVAQVKHRYAHLSAPVENSKACFSDPLDFSRDSRPVRSHALVLPQNHREFQAWGLEPGCVIASQSEIPRSSPPRRVLSRLNLPVSSNRGPPAS